MISIESLAVFLAVLYLLLAVKQNIFCWLAAILSATLYFSVMYSAGLYMEAYLQIFYVGMQSMDGLNGTLRKSLYW